VCVLGVKGVPKKNVFVAKNAKRKGVFVVVNVIDLHEVVNVVKFVTI
jgi:hypothetical protein